ncbi:MAG: gamma-glutamyltransferase [Chloroflexi bacterium]|nr:gamma-glutamyltransferase [Chloroflexota bacterium]
MVVTNHPMGSAAGLEMLSMGGNAVDAAIAAVFALSVVEPMMVGPFGGGYINLRTADGESVCIDNYTLAPSAATPEMYRPVSDTWPDYLLTEDRESQVGYLAVGVPGNLKAWEELHSGYGKLGWEAVIAPAIRYAENGFPASAYLVRLITENREDIGRFPATAEIFLPDGSLPVPGQMIVRRDYAESLKAIASGGAAELYDGPLGHAIAEDMRRNGGVITVDDLRGYSTLRKEPVKGTYRGYEIAGPPPGNTGITLIIEMLNILENFDIAGLGFGTEDGLHILAESLKIAFADRFEYLGDPATIEIPLDWLTSKDYAAQRASDINMRRASAQLAGTRTAESLNTTHLTTADDDGNMVSMTQTINELFGSKVTVPGTGILLNNTQAMFDPHPGRPNSVGPNKRVVSSMSPTIVSKDGRPFLGIGTPGGVRIFGTVMQGIMNVIDHGMTLQEAVEAPRLWTQGQDVELEQGFGDGAHSGMSRLGHPVMRVSNVAGGMNGILVDHERGLMTGAACWRADGVPAGLSGGPAKVDAGFNPLA